MRYFFLSLLLSLLTFNPLPAPAASDWFVSPQGSDRWSGSLASPNGEKSDGPFATLERARQAIREAEVPLSGTRTVWVQGGTYERTEPFLLENANSGTPGSPVLYRGAPGETVFVTGGKKVEGLTPVTDPAVLERLPEEARGSVLQSDLRAQGVSDFGKMTARGFGQPVYKAGLELFCEGEPMTLARWPNEGWTQIAAVPSATDGDRFDYEGDRPARWTEAEDLWIHGYWTWDWADSYVAVGEIHPESHEIVTQAPHGVYGYKPDRRFYALNLIEELDQPGEWYLNRDTGILYFWPPSDFSQADVQVSVADSLVKIQEASHVKFRGLVFEITRGTAIEVQGGSHVAIEGCVIRNTGNDAVNLGNGEYNRVVSCDIYHNGDGGVSLGGGDRKTLTPGNQEAVNNHLSDYSRWSRTYRPAVGVGGVGNRVAHNHIHDAPHTGIQLGGNEHVIEFNNIHDVCRETGDCGAFYMGRDWTQRGIKVRYNFFHRIGGFNAEGRFSDAQSVYLDDWTSGIDVIGNVIYQGGRGILIGGGRDNLVENNIFVDCKPSVHVDSRGLGWAKNYFNGETTTLTDRLEAMNYKEPPYSVRYPELLTLYEDDPAVAKGNRILRNISVGEKWLDLMNGLTTDIVEVKDNFTEGDPIFIDPEKLDFRIKEDSPVWNLGIKQIPMERMGLLEDALRKELPSEARLQ